MLFRIVFIVACLNSIDCLNDFCSFYKCDCSKSKEIKCNLKNSTIKTVDVSLVNSNVVKLDLSDNYLENLVASSGQSKIRQLILRNNKIKVISENFFDKLPELNQLDLSSNLIESMKENAFINFNSTLLTLNLSNAFVPNYTISRELCELISLKVLDLSYANLEDLNFECWKDHMGELQELHLKFTLNVEKSWSKWYPFIGTKLQLIDLTSSNLITIDANLSKQSLLSTIILAHNKQLDKAELHKLLNTDNLISRLTSLNLANVTASESLTSFIDNSSNDTLKLEHLDVSFNNFSDDLNTFLFNQPKFKKLKSFRASHNQFKNCETKLLMPNKTLLVSLETIDLSYNQLKGAQCLYSIKSIDSLCELNLSHNKLNMIDSDLNDLVDMFSKMLKLSSIDLSFNSFTFLTFYFNPNHVFINKFDVSKNLLKHFRFVSLKLMESAKYPLNLKEPEDYDDDSEENSNDLVIDNKHHLEDDDERYIVINNLNLSQNNFERINLQHMLQSIRNVNYLDLSHNPIYEVARFSNEASIIPNDYNIVQDDLTEILCVDEIDLSNCKLESLPNLEHICINKLNFAYNSLNGHLNLLMSNFSTYFNDYINLQFNNITYINIRMSKQKFKQDLYVHKNSPNSYHFGRANSTNLIHTYIDLKNNIHYKCVCDQIRLVKENDFIQILNECLDDKNFSQQCTNANRVTITSLNKKFRILFVITCGLLIMLSGLIVYYMCSDCVKNMQPDQTIHRFWTYFKNLGRKNFETNNESSTSSRVIYTKLDNDLLSSSNNINFS